MCQTYDFRRRSSVCVRSGVGVAPVGVVVRVARESLRLRDRAPFPFVDDEVDGHLALEAADVTVAEVVAQFVNLEQR